MTAILKGPWTREQVADFLDRQVIPLRVGCHTSSSWPVVASHWFLHREGALWCATQASAKIVRYLRDDPRCAFELATEGMPYRGVRGQGRAHIDPERGPEVLRALIQRYLGGEDSGFAQWLLARAQGEVAIRIEPTRLRSWDFTRRMTGGDSPGHSRG